MNRIIVLFSALFIAIAPLTTSCTASENAFTVVNGKLLNNGEPYYYIGTNIWYAADLYKIDKARLFSELDTLREMGITNLRILASDADIESLQRMLEALEERAMVAVLYLNNSWEWSEKGYRYYLKEAGEGEQPTPAKDGYHPYINAMSEFASNPKALELYYADVKEIVSQLKDSPAIFAWQICNEPRPFSTDKKKVNDFVNYIESTAKLIKSIDPDHLVCIGSEGLIGCNDNDTALLERINRISAVDYMTIHIWPYNWNWVGENDLESNIDIAFEKTEKYINEHIKIAEKISKPLVIEEFGYPRDGFAYEYSSSTSARDKYYEYIFSKLIESAQSNGILMGCNFWAWNGYAKQTEGHQFWQPGDDLCGDPKHEAQGLYGVYIKDNSTLELIKRSIAELRTEN